MFTHKGRTCDRELSVIIPPNQSSRPESGYGYLTTLFSNEDCQRRGDLSAISSVHQTLHIHALYTTGLDRACALAHSPILRSKPRLPWAPCWTSIIPDPALLTFWAYYSLPVTVVFCLTVM